MKTGEIREIKTVTITEKGQIAIPKAIRNMKGFEKGSKIGILIYTDRMELRPMKQISQKLENAFASEKVLAKDWNSKEDNNAWKDL